MAFPRRIEDQDVLSILAARAARVPWKLIMRRFGGWVSRQAVHERATKLDNVTRDGSAVADVDREHACGSTRRTSR